MYSVSNNEAGNGDPEISLDVPDQMAQFVIMRFRTMSYFAGCVPNEYSSLQIRGDMLKAGFRDVPDEAGIDDIISRAKCVAYDAIFRMLMERKPIAEIREWCELSPMSTIPVSPISTVNMNTILTRFDYFNYEVNRILRKKQVELAMQERKKSGSDFSVRSMGSVYEGLGLTEVSDEFTRIMLLGMDELSSIIEERLSASRELILGMLLENPDRDSVAGMASSSPEIVFSEGEIMEVVDDIIDQERLSIITREVSRMATREIWDFINTVDSYRIDRYARLSTGSNSPTNNNTQALETLRMNEQKKDSLREGYMFQVSRLTNGELSHLVRLIQAYISWKNTFHYLDRVHYPSASDLAGAILDGFSHEHGVSPEAFRRFIL